MEKVLLSLTTLFLCQISDAKDYGVMGQVFEIKEENMLEMIISRLKKLEKSGNLLQHQKLLAEKARTQSLRPRPVEGIIKTKEARTFSYDPSITVPQDYKDHRGQVFAKAGSRVNPLDSVSLSKPILFFDGDDESQVAWAKKQADNAKWVLVKGSSIELENLLRRPVYFDQHGSLTKKLGIKQVPARLSQQGKKLQVEEILLNAQ